MKVAKASTRAASSPTRKAASKGKSAPSPTADDDDDHHLHSGAEEDEAIARGGVATPFPWKLHEMLEDAAKDGNEWIVSWQAHGRSFIVHKPKIFVEKIMPTYFNQSKFASFQRQLNLYGFCRLTSGKDKGAYYHSCFVRGQRGLCRGMIRQKIKGTKVRRTLAPEEEPDFYALTKTSPDAPSPACMESQQERAREVVCPPMIAPRVVSVGSISGKERAMKARQERLNAVRDVLRQTDDVVADEMNFGDEDPQQRPTVSATSSRRNSGCSSVAFVPSVITCTPMESEESDCEESSIDAMRPLADNCSRLLPPTTSTPPSFTIPLPPPMLETPLEPAAPGFTRMTPDQIKGGDLLFFEGKPFHYLEHLDSLPPPPVPAVHHNYQKPKQVDPAPCYYPRDSLQSLMRVDPHAIMGASFGIRQIP